MSSAAPQWSLAELITAATAYGYDGIELRVEWGHRHGLELDSSQATRREARQRCRDAGVGLSCLALGTRFNLPTAEERQASAEQAKQYSGLAADLGAPFLRVFGGPMPRGATMQTVRDDVAEALRCAADLTRDSGVIVCLETHDDFHMAEDVAACLDKAGADNLGAVWHAAHHVRRGVDVDQGYALLRDRIRHCHLQELPAPGRPAVEADLPIPLGEGDGHILRSMQLLHRDDFQGYLSVEGGNRSGDPRDPNPVLAQYGGGLREYLAGL